MIKDKKQNVIDHQLLMTELCTICNKIFQIQENNDPNVIEIQNDYYCEECLQEKLLQQQQNIRNIQEKYIYYKQYESSFNTKQYCELNLKNTQSQQDQIRELTQIVDLQKQILNLDQLLLKTKQESEILKQKVIFIQNQQEKFWDSINRFQKRALKLEQKATQAKLQKGVIRAQSQSLTSNSLYHQVFKITIKDNIGYMLNLAMGKKLEASQPVWEQFNIGFGHLFLALNILALKYQYNYTKFQSIELKANLTEVLLYGKDKKYCISYSKDNEKQFGQILQALLVQISDFNYHLLEKLRLQYNPDVKLPYAIKQKQFKIADIAINPNKIAQKQKWVKWSEGLKYLLIDFKHLMTIHAIYGKD